MDKKADQLLLDINNVGKTADGRAVLLAILEMTGWPNTPFDAESSNNTYFTLGKFDVGRELVLLMEAADPDLLINIMKDLQNENNSE